MFGMKISVIIPSYNRAHVLGRALDSILMQSYSADEIIVIDDGSRDGTAELLSHYPQIKVIHSSKNRGVSAARNQGIQAARNEWIAFLDSDDAWMPEKLAQQVTAVQNATGMRFVHTDEIWIRRGKRVNPMHKHAKPDGWIYQASLALCCVSPSSVLLHRSVLDACGLFDESLPACEDYDLWLRIFCHYPVRLVRQKLTVKYGGHADQLSQKYWGMDRFRVTTLCKLLDSQHLNNDNSAQTLKMLQTKCEILAKGARKRRKYREAARYEQIVERYTLEKPRVCHV